MTKLFAVIGIFLTGFITASTLMAIGYAEQAEKAREDLAKGSLNKEAPKRYSTGVNK